MTQEFVLTLFGVIGVIWLTQTILGALGVKEPANKLIFLAVVVIGVLVVAGVLVLK